MHCSVCNSTTHTKRKCPDKDKLPIQPATKRSRGRPRKNIEVVDGQEHGNGAYYRSAEPTRRGGRGRGIGGRGGRGRRGNDRGRITPPIPRGFGAYVDSEGATFVNTDGQGGPFNISNANMPMQTSQASTTTPPSSHRP